MAVQDATDNLGWPVKYLFQCVEDDAFSSEWQSSTTYEATGLDPSTLTAATTYTFRVMASDRADSGPNDTAWSTSVAADTDLITGWTDSTPDSYDSYEHPAPAGVNRVMLVFGHGVAHDDRPQFTAMTYGGQALTQIAAFGVQQPPPAGDKYGATAEIWILDEAGIAAAEAAGSATVVSTVDDALNGVGIAVSSIFYEGVDQTTPWTGEVFSFGTPDNGPQVLPLTVTGLDPGDVIVANSSPRHTNPAGFTWAPGDLNPTEVSRLGENKAWAGNSGTDIWITYSLAQMIADDTTETLQVTIQNSSVSTVTAIVLNHDGTNDVVPIYIPL